MYAVGGLFTGVRPLTLSRTFPLASAPAKSMLCHGISHVSCTCRAQSSWTCDTDEAPRPVALGLNTDGGGVSPYVTWSAQPACCQGKRVQLLTELEQSREAMPGSMKPPGEDRRAGA